MGKNRLNNKGYMLVEIILASAIAFGIAYFIMDMTINLKNKNDDLLVETLTMTDQTIITNMIMEKIKANPNEFECKDVTLNDKVFVVSYKEEVKDKKNIVNEYADVKLENCEVTDNKITVDISLSVSQMPDKNFDVNVTYYKKIVNPYLYEEVSVGDYISYTGNNGCSGEQCNGLNANQKSTTDKSKFGSCSSVVPLSSESGTYYSYGWRVLYTTSDSVYIISAGSPECVGDVVDDINASKKNLNDAALKYCNSSYVFGGVCNGTTAHAFNGSDFYTFTSKHYGTARYLYDYNDGGTYGSNFCFEKKSSEDKYCGHDSDIINVGSNYWFAAAANNDYLMAWDSPLSKIVMPGGRLGVGIGDTDIVDPLYSGVRPVIRLDSSIKITGGSGTLVDPYKISTRS